MKHTMIVLLSVLFCCSVLLSCPACADAAHVPEDLYAQSDYLVFSPEFNGSQGKWELWVLAYRTGSANHTGAANCELDQCVSASLLSLKNPAAAASTISTLLGTAYELEDMMEIADVRYYMFSEYWKACYLASPGGELTTVAPVSAIEITDTREGQMIYLNSVSSRPAYMLLCQFWLYAGWYNQKPSSITKVYGMDPEQSQPLYSDNVSDYCSNQDALQRYCDSLIPTVSSVSSGDTGKPHFMTNIYYSKGDLELCVSPNTDGLSLILRTGSW